MNKKTLRISGQTGKYININFWDFFHFLERKSKPNIMSLGEIHIFLYCLLLVYTALTTQKVKAPHS